jgi:hypothetical protein
MTKDLLQQELLEKVKPGMKPSDIKKERQKSSKIPLSSSPMSISKSDEGYESDKSINPDLSKSRTTSFPTAPPLPNQNLLNQINSLQKQLQLYKDFRESDLKIKEGYKETIEQLREENSRMKQTIAQLENPANPTEKSKEAKPEPQPKLYFFTCDICEQNKKSQLHLGKVNGLGVDPNKQNKICDTCLKRVDLIQPPKEDFF